MAEAMTPRGAKDVGSAPDRSADELAADINTDRPCITLNEDAFDFEPTVRAIARTIRLAPAPRGLVLHVDGEWGAGKSSALAFVKQILREDSHKSELPTLLDFSPWWFTDRDDLAKQLLQQLRLELPPDSKLLAVGALIAQFSEQLGHVIGTGLTAAVGAPVPGADKAATAALKRLKPAEKTLPQLKEQICEALRLAKRRIVVFIDDVDRLAPSEIDQLFRVIKAVADFPNVVYVLAFDGAQVGTALETQLKVDGRSYLEKIVQVPFLLPIPTRERLRERLEDRVRVIAGSDLPKDDYTDRVLRAMTYLIRRPRDLARFSNAFSCTYPVIAGEVHPVDAAALDLLRVLGLKAFWAIRDHSDDFMGIRGHDRDGKVKAAQLAFHETWHEGLSTKRARDVDHLVELLFPHLTALRRDLKSSEDSRLLSTEGRVASPRGHAVYFQLRAPDWALTHQRRDAIFAITDPDALLREWDVLIARGHPGGLTQAADLLLQVTLWEVSPGFARAFVQSILRVGDDLYRSGDGRRLDFDVLTTAFTHCVERLEDEHLANVLQAIVNAESVVGAMRVVRRYQAWADTASSRGTGAPSWLDAHAVERMSTHMMRRITAVAQEGILLSQPRAMDLLSYWFHFGKEEFEPWLRTVLAHDAMLIELIEAFLHPQGSANENQPGSEVFHGEYLSGMMPADRPMEKNLRAVERIAATESQALQQRALRLAPHLRRHLEKYPAAPAKGSRAPGNAPMVDTDANGAES